MTFPNSGTLDYIPDGAVFWVKVGQRDLPVVFPDATTTKKGVVEKATTAQAQAGTDDEAYMTASTTSDVTLGSRKQEWQDLSSVRELGVNITNNSGAPRFVSVSSEDKDGATVLTMTITDANGNTVTSSRTSRGSTETSAGFDVVIGVGDVYKFEENTSGTPKITWLEKSL